MQPAKVHFICFLILVQIRLFSSFFWLSAADISIPNAINSYLPLPEEQIVRSYTRGNSYLMNGKFPQALTEINHAIQFLPTNPDFYITRGIIYEKLFRWDEAIQDYQKANELKKSKWIFAQDDATIFSNLANAEAGANRYPDALRDFNYAVQLDPQFLAPQIGKALMQFQLGDDRAAFTFFQKISEDYPAFADGQACYAVMLFNSDNTEKALSTWESALELDDRYDDLEWIRTIRRWPPRLVSVAEKLQSQYNQHQ